jgi:hypothetical protein
VPARQFGKAKSVTRLRDRYPDGADDLAGAERGLEQAPEKSVGRDRAPLGAAGDLDLAPEREQAGREFRRWVRERNRTPYGPAVADRRMGDMRNGHREKRCKPRHLQTMFGLRVAYQAPQLDLPIALGDLAKIGNPVDIDQQRRGR